MLKRFQIIICLFLSFSSFSQSKIDAKKMIDTLSSTTMCGRGYVNNGDLKAALYIRNEFNKIGLHPFEDNYFQKFQFSINTFSGKVECSTKKKKYELGKDFLALPFSSSGKGKATFQHLDSLIYKKNGKINTSFLSLNLRKKAIYISDKTFEKLTKIEFDYMEKVNSSKCIMRSEQKLTHSLSTLQYPQRYLVFNDSVLPAHNEKIRFKIQSEFVPKYTSQNVIGYVEGTSVPDSFLIVSAHYDHLGKMGSVYFPGANDNASGTAMLLDLAGYFVKNPLKYSIVFIAFGAEEVGLIGSEYFTNHPLTPLKQIKCVLNIDLMASGKDGITVVNGKVFPELYKNLHEINNTHHLLPKINARGEAKNSDHYHFSKKGVPAIFVYALGGSKAYHDVYDIAENVSLDEYDDIITLFKLFLQDF